MKRLVSIIALLIIFATTAQTQPRFTRADIDASLTSGQMTFHSATNAEGSTFNLGAPGGGNTYDFTVYQYSSDVMERVFIDPSLAPHVGQFPDATHVQFIDVTEGASYMYFMLTDNGLYSLGIASEYQGFPFLLEYDPPKPELKLPLELGTKWTYRSAPSMPFEGYEQQIDMDVDVIGAGTLNTPFGSAAALCIKNISKMTTRILVGGQVLSESYTTTVDYMFLAHEGIGGSIYVDSVDINSMTPTIEDANLSVSGAVNSVQPAPFVSELTIDAVWPNPAFSSGDVNVSWSLGTPQTVELTVHDMLGRTHVTMDYGWNVTGIHNTSLPLSTLPAGPYVIRLRAGAQSVQRMFNIIR